MRLRWITALSALALKILLIGVMLLLGRVVLRRNYANLEREDAEGTLDQVCVILESQLQDLDIITHDYASWDSTYRFMLRPSPEYVRADLSESTFQTRHMHLYLLLDPQFKVVLAKPFGDVSHASLAADVGQIVKAVKRRAQPDKAVFGLLSLTAGPAMVAIRPVLTTRETGPSRGTLIIVRDLGPEDLAMLSRLAAVPVTISGTADDSDELASSSELKHSSVAMVALDEENLIATAMVNDLWRQPRIRLQISEERFIWQQGKKTIRHLVIGLIVVGLLFAVVNTWVMQRLVVRRVERLIRLTSDTETEAGLNARVYISGSDELAQLGHRMNKMLERLQNSHEALLSIQERLRYEATHDNLTGIWNRGAAMRLLDQELARSAREGTPVSVILFDADHFKDINDTYGHSTGDRALQNIAAAITRSLRNSDVCCRYGGEEFLVIAANCSLENATQLAQRILAYVRATPVSVLEHSFQVTLSAGVTVFTSGSKAEDLIVMADRALYRAKESGRDRIETEIPPTDSSARNLRFAPSGLPQPT